MPLRFPHAFPLNAAEIAGALSRLENRTGRLRFYCEVYPTLLTVAAGLPRSRAGDIALAHIAYGWMPTGLKRIESGNEGTSLLDKIADIQVEQVPKFLEELETSPINGSWVGLSKVLHLARPDAFPIWDKRVAKRLGGKHRYEWERGAAYAEYASSIHRWSRQTDRHVVAVAHCLGYDVSTIRAAELLLLA